jgi:cyclopropane fatty-acyl-phospholipid synthase-like methyltransferase
MEIGSATIIETEYRGLKIHAASNLHKSCLSVIDSLDLPGSARVLDLGAGEGAFSMRLLDRGHDVVAVELDPTRFKLGIPNYNLDLNDDFQAEVSNRCGDQFDLVVAIEIIEHLANPRHFITNCLGLLKPDGFLVLTTPNLESWLSRIKFLREGRFLWFEEEDYRSYGHITPIFSWQIAQVCRENNAELRPIHNTDDIFLRQRLGNRVLKVLRNKALYMSVLRPLMKGRKRGEIGIYTIRKRA